MRCIWYNKQSDQAPEFAVFIVLLMISQHRKREDFQSSRSAWLVESVARTRRDPHLRCSCCQFQNTTYFIFRSSSSLKRLTLTTIGISGILPLPNTFEWPRGRRTSTGVVSEFFFAMYASPVLAGKLTATKGIGSQYPFPCLFDQYYIFEINDRLLELVLCLMRVAPVNLAEVPRVTCIYGYLSCCPSLIPRPQRCFRCPPTRS